jgi:hypothetical protein
MLSQSFGEHLKRLQSCFLLGISLEGSTHHWEVRLKVKISFLKLTGLEAMWRSCVDATSEGKGFCMARTCSCEPCLRDVMETPAMHNLYSCSCSLKRQGWSSFYARFPKSPGEIFSCASIFHGNPVIHFETLPVNEPSFSVLYMCNYVNTDCSWF